MTAWLKVLGLTAALCFGAAVPVLAQLPVTGFDSGASAVVGTPGASSHAAGTAVGPVGNTLSGGGQITNALTQSTNQSGLFVIPWARQNGLSGIITQVALTSSGGSTGQYVLRIWSKLPVNTTCVDNTAFVGNFTTDDAYLITPPFSVTLAAPAVTTGDARTYGSVTVQTYDVQNEDQPSTRNLYVCVQTVSTDTADESAPMRVMISGPQN